MAQPVLTIHKALPATFTVDMGKEYKINKLTYVPRQSGGANGYITSYDLYVKKAESDDWTQVVTDGVWASDTKEKTAKFNTVDARYIKFVAKEGSNVLLLQANSISIRF